MNEQACWRVSKPWQRRENAALIAFHGGCPDRIPWRPLGDGASIPRQVLTLIESLQKEHAAPSDDLIAIPVDGVIVESQIAYCPASEPEQMAQARMELEKAQAAVDRVWLELRKFKDQLEIFEEHASIAFTMQEQQQTEWCWAAVATSVVHYYESGSAWTQCEVVNAQKGLTTCCQDGGSDTCNQGGPLNAIQLVGHLDHNAATLSKSEIMQAIKTSRPIGVVIAWNGGGGHIVAIVGHQNAGEILEIADPWYGSSRVAYDDFVARYQGSGRWTYTAFTQP